MDSDHNMSRGGDQNPLILKGFCGGGGGGGDGIHA